MSKDKKRDFAQIAFDVVQEATGQATPPDDGKKNPAAVALGRLGGLKGGAARAKALTAARRREIAKKAAEARWARSEESP